uniref:(northern house mosquito) hypothetical protein n=1 Tax=Culex pipiens TaxID=7175 RepID=A0A8D8I2Y1_CULPI
MASLMYELFPPQVWMVDSHHSGSRNERELLERIFDLCSLHSTLKQISFLRGITTSSYWYRHNGLQCLLSGPSREFARGHQHHNERQVQGSGSRSASTNSRESTNSGIRFGSTSCMSSLRILTG